MMKTILAACGASLFGLLMATLVSAQEPATILLRDGQRQAGELVDLNASGFTLRMNGNERQIPKSEVAALEFVAGTVPAEARAAYDANRPFVVLRNGDVVEGQLSDIGGTHPLRVTIDTGNGTKDYTSNDVARVYMRGAKATATNVASPPAGAITVPANEPWTKTGITVARGERITFSPSGEIRIATDKTSQPGGNTAATDPNMKYPVFNAPVGALIARVGSGQPFAIGAGGQPIAMPATGQLFLGINDNHFPDNTGAYTVMLDRQSR